MPYVDCVRSDPAREIMDIVVYDPEEGDAIWRAFQEDEVEDAPEDGAELEAQMMNGGA